MAMLRAAVRRAIFTILLGVVCGAPERCGALHALSAACCEVHGEFSYPWKIFSQFIQRHVINISHGFEKQTAYCQKALFFDFLICDEQK